LGVRKLLLGTSSKSETQLAPSACASNSNKILLIKKAEAKLTIFCNCAHVILSLAVFQILFDFFDGGSVSGGFNHFYILNFKKTAGCI
jgi:hypothetical protein